MAEPVYNDSINVMKGANAMPDDNQDQTPQANGAQSGGDQGMGNPAANPIPRNFGNPLARASGPQVSIAQGVHPNLGFQPLPQPTGPQPYHLALDHVLSADQIAAISAAGRLVFHSVGDTGGIKNPQVQQVVANKMVDDYNASDATARPAFFYHLGDVVYYTGQDSEYYAQFYEPYQLYPLPIFAIPGNHDGEVADSTQQSLGAFVTNFCAPIPTITKDAGDTHRDAMTQPNVYWTLEAPFVTFIGLYTNVPEGGQLDDYQIAWFESELSSAPADKALIVTMHHPIYSVDQFHSGSQYMRQVLEQAIQKTGRTPDAVFSGHVHNYQRFTRGLNGYDVPFIVAGAGGYWNLHIMQKDQNGKDFPKPQDFPDLGVTLVNYCADRHGYLRVEVTPQTLKGEYFAAPGSHQAPSGAAQLIDSFTLDLKTHKLVS
jgi:hypothetical protein